jgi:enoyl-CoA hydratase/3-hydroxyacyl-CoA dehydrogenase
MGPFELMNVTGVPIALHAATTLGAAFGPLYAPASRLRAQVESGKPWILEGTTDTARADAVADRLRGVTFYVAAALVDEGVGTMEDTDIGARVGLRWPLGPFELMNRLGVGKAAALARSLAERHGVDVPRGLRDKTDAAAPFAFRRIKEEVAGGIATLTLNRPDAMNALNEEVVEQLHDAFRRAVRDERVRGIVLSGAGKAFVAGADIRFFVKNLEAKNLDRIVSFTRAGHALLDEIDRSPKPVVARLDGLALGGGLELALACDAILATPKAAMAFPETGIGIYPGLGGTQRLTRRVGVGLAKWLVFTGQMLRAEDAAAIGLVDEVVAHGDLDAAVLRAIERGPRADRPVARPVPERYRGLESFFSAHDADRIREGAGLDLSAEELAKAAKQVKSKAPVALRIAETLIVEGAKRPLAEGLEMELAQLVPIFSTKDAYEGLSTLGKRPPVFEGR